MPREKELLLTGAFPVAFQWCSSVFQLCKLTLGRHWDTTGSEQQPVWFQWHPSVLVPPVVFQCVRIMQINTGSPLGHHWVLASASVVQVAFQCTCGPSGLPLWSVQWCPSVLTESGLEIIGSGHFPACNPLCLQLVWSGLFELNWFHLNCHPNYTKKYNGAYIKGMHIMLKCSLVLRAELVSIAEQ